MTMINRSCSWDGISREVIEKLESIPREAFMSAHLSSFASVDSPFSIGYGQTISQPFIVAYMTDRLQLKSTDRVLEIGTGSGYQSALLSLLASHVYTVERISELSLRAEQTLEELGYHTISYHTGDGKQGWPEHAPYDKIIVTAAAAELPLQLVGQLKRGGSMIIPLGPAGEVQYLYHITRDLQGEVQTRPLIPVRFVPLL
ncbi:MAG: protein-L-isoaspartate(D-aspartate) O-methyltransferase [Spirochaetia bacterium]|nr:protein-L-isoaspartate(D-aspartate) O-methyltransferase [Spirochaetia bacterium]